MNHYETLGVERDADEHALKRAFRRARSAAHPDRHGGSEEAMKAVNRAYDCLINPDRRSWYDETGLEGPEGDPAQVENKVLEAHARQCLTSVFAQVLDADRDSDLLRLAEQCMRETRAKAERTANQAEVRACKLRARRERMAAKGENLLHALIDTQCADLDQTAETNRHAVKVFDAAMALLGDYSTNERPTVRASADQDFFDAVQMAFAAPRRGRFA